MRLNRGEKRKSGKKGNKRKKAQWGDEENDDVENISRGGDPSRLSDEESHQLANRRRRLPPRETQEKYDKLYRVMKRTKELDAKKAFHEKMSPCEVEMKEKKQRRVRSKIMTQCLPAASQEEPPHIIGSKEQQLRWQDDEVSSDGWVVEEEDDVMDLENYFADKDEEEVFGPAVKRRGVGDNDSCSNNNNSAERENQLSQECGRPAIVGDDPREGRTVNQGGVAGDGESVSTEKMAVINPGSADTTSYALRFMEFDTLPEDSADQLVQERPVFHKPAPDKDREDLCQCLGLEVVYGRYDKVEEDSKEKGWNLLLSNESDLTESYGIYPLLARQWKGTKRSRLSDLILTPLLAYRDLVYCAERWEDWKELQWLYSMHILNHVISARRIVTNTNRRLRRLAREQGEVRAATDENRGKGRTTTKKNEGRKMPSKKVKQEQEHDIRQDIAGAATPVHIGDDGDKWDWKRDQGFTRPIVLILCPMRHWAYSVVSTMVSLLGPDASVANLKRFDEEFGGSEEEEKDEDVDNVAATLTPKQRRDAFVVKQKPKDWQALFGKGLNCDDDFKIGISITMEGGKKNVKKGGSKGLGVRLYSSWYQSDIIVASPLGLMLLVESLDGDADFLSSIEVCIVDGSDVLAMQNWGHVMSALERCNKMPTSQHDVDFSRVRTYHLHGQSSLIRQMVFMGAVSDAPLNACVAAYSRNTKGCMKVIKNWNGTEGAALDVLVDLEQQVFQRVPCSNASNVNDARFQYFKKIVLPSLISSGNGHILLFVPSYYDFVRVRNALVRQEANVVFVSEYSRVSEIARGRARFFNGQKPILVYSGRAHFFHRYRIRGAQRIVFYSPPPHALFYLEMINALEDCGGGGEGLSSLLLFTRYDSLTLTPLLGAKRARNMLLGSEETFVIQ